MSLFDDKLAALEAASANKKSDLFDAALRRGAELAPTMATQAEGNRKESFPGRLAERGWVDPQSGIYDALNVGTQAVSGVSTILGNLAAVPNTTAGGARLRNMAPGVQEAWNRKQAGNASPEDEQLLALPRGFTTTDPDKLNPYQRRVLQNMTRTGFGQGEIETNEQAFAKGVQNIQTAENIKDASSYASQVDQSESQRLQNDLVRANAPDIDNVIRGTTNWTSAPIKKSAQLVSGVAGLATNWIGAGAQNPAATFGLIAENAPQLVAAAAGGAMGMAATNLPYAVDAFREGLTEFQKNNKGEVPTRDEINIMAAKAVSLAAAETAGDVLTLGAGRVLNTTRKIAGDATADAAESTLRKALKGVGKVYGGALGEAATEGYQTIVENNIKGKSTTADEALMAAGMGALVGGSVKGGLTVAGASSAKAAETSAAYEQAKKDRAAVQNAVANKDPSAFLDPNASNYRPDLAVQTLKSMNTSDTVTPVERQANIDQAKIITDNLDSDVERHVAAQALRADPEKKAERLTQLNEVIKEHEEVFTAEDAKDPDNKAVFDLYNSAKREVKMLEASDKVFAGSMKAAERRIAETADIVSRINRDEATKTDFDTEADVLDKAAVGSVEADTASKRVLNLAMSTPERINPSRIEALVSNESNGLSAKDRGYLQKWVAARKEVENLKSFDDVSSDILNGNKKEGFLGLEQHRAEISTAINEGNFAKASQSAAKLQSFVNNHAAKTDAINEAYAQAQQDRGNHYPVRQQDGTWAIEDAPPTTGKNGTDWFNIHPGSNKNGFVSRMGQEAKALASTYAELRAAYQLRKNADSPVAANALQEPAAPVATPSAAQAAPVRQATQPVAKNEATAEQKYRSQVLSWLTKGGDPLTAEQDAVVSALPPNLVAAAQKTRSIQEGLRQAEEVLDDAELNAARVDAARELTALRPKMQELFAAIEEQRTKPNAEPEASSKETVAQQPVTAEQSAPVKTEAAPKQEQTQETVEAKAEPALSVLSQFNADAAKEIPAKVFRKVNRVSQFIRQQKPKEGAASQKPLATVKDFLSQWTDGKVFPEQMLKDGITTDQQRNAINSLYNTLQEWNPKVMENYVAKGINEQFTADIFQELYLDGKPVTDENITTAISAAAYMWAADSNGIPAYRSIDQVADMFGFTNYDPNAEIDGRLARVLGHQHTLQRELGRAAVQSLGLTASKKAPKDIMAKLEMALGMRAAALLMDVGAIKPTYIPVNDINRAFGMKVNPAQDNAVNSFYEIQRDKYALPPVLQEIADANKHSNSIVSKLFDVQKAPVYAVTEKGSFRQEFAKRSTQKVPKFLEKVLDKQRNTPQTVIPNMLSLFRSLGDDAVIAAAGGKADANVHARNKDSAEAKREGLRNELTLMNDMLNDPTLKDGINTEFYSIPEVWKNFRVGIATRSLNPQSSKIHRFAFQQPGWKGEINLNNDEQMGAWILGIAQNSGLVATDKQSNAKTIELAKQAFATDEKFKAAVAAVSKTLGKVDQAASLSQAEKDAISGFAAANEGIMSLQALVSYAEYQKALNEGASKFTTTLLVGADGKTNGPMLTMLSLGVNSAANAWKVLNMGGMYSRAEGQAKNFSEFIQKDGAQDLYQDTGSAAMPAINAQAMGSVRNKAVLDAIQVFTGKLEVDGKLAKGGRNIVKTPLTAFFFGSSLGNALKSSTAKFIDDVYKAIESIPNAKDPEAQRKIVINAINALGNKKIPTDTTFDQLMANDLSYWGIDESHIAKQFNTAVGRHITAAMEANFQSYALTRNDFSTATNAAYLVYTGAKSALYTAEMNRLMDAGEIDFIIGTKGETAGQRIPLHDMNAEQQAAFNESIKDIMPTINSAYSVEQGGDLDYGIMLAKTRTAPVDRNLRNTYTTKASFARDYPSASIDGKASKNMTSIGEVTAEAAPGAMGLPASIHSMDSYDMHHATDKVDNSLNVHDEISNGFNKVATAANAINNAAFDSLINYNPMMEARNTLYRVLSGVAQRHARGEIDAATMASIGDALSKLMSRGDEKVSPKDAINNLINDTHSTAVSSNTNTLETLADMSVMDQYTWETGQANITDAQRKAAADKLNNIPRDIPESVLHAGDLFLVAFGKAKTAAREAQKIEFPEDIQEIAKVKDAVQLGLSEAVAPTVVNAMPAPQVAPVAKAMKEGKSLAEAMNGLKDRERVAATAEIKAVVANVPKNTFNAWGEFGEPTVSDPNLVYRMDAKPKQNKAEIVKTLYNVIKNGPQNNVAQFQMELLKQLNAALPADLTVNYIHSTTPHDGQTVMQNARGWYTGENNNIYVLGTDYAHSQVTPEVFLHEMLHAALANAVQDGIDNPKSASPEALELVKNLTALQAKAKQYAMEKNLAGKYADALTNVHEFMAWGMTNADFQKEVLGNISMRASYTGNSLVSGMKAVVAAFKNFLFRKSGRSPQAIAVNGLTAMITNVSGLLKDAQNRETTLRTIAQNTAAAQESQRKALNLAMAAHTAQAVQAKSIEDVFTYVKDTETNPRSPEFNDHLSNMVERVSTQILGSFGTARADMMKDAARTPEDVHTALLQDPNWVEPSAYAIGLPFNQTETFVANQVEAAMRSVLGRKEAQTMVGVRELQKTYNEVAERLTPEHFMDAANGDAHVAAAIYDGVTNTNAPDYLARFAALALSNEAFGKVLGQLEVAQKQKPGSLFGRAMAALEAVLEFINGKLTKTDPTASYDVQMKSLVDYVMSTEQKLRNKEIDAATKGQTYVDSFYTGANNKITSSVQAIGQSDLFQKSKFATVTLAGNALSALAGSDAASHLLDGLRAYRNKTFKDRDGFIASQLADVMGVGQNMEKLLRYAKNNERNRMQVQQAVGKSVLSGFKDANFTPEQYRGITNTFLRTDAQSLLDAGYSVKDMEKLLGDSKHLDGEIARAEGNIPKSAFSNFYVGAAKALGYYLATGKVTTSHMLFNAHNIARLGGTKDQSKVAEADAQAVQQTIDVLASLYAIKYTSGADKNAALGVLKTENARGKQNGVEFLTKMHKGLVEDSRNYLFSNTSEVLMMKGWTPEITNPHITVKAVPLAEVAQMKLAGWVQQGNAMRTDPADKNATPTVLMTRPDGGMAPHETGLMGYTSLHSKGTDVGNDNSSAVGVLTQAKAAGRNTYAGNFDPTKVNDNFMAPVLNEFGNVVNYRYMMANAVRDNVLQRDNRFDKVMGAFAAATLNKVETSKQNERMVKALHDQFLADNKKIAGTDGYIEFGPNSKDEFIKEHWAMLPAATKEDIFDVWGTNSMMIRADQFNLVFGSRMPSIADVFKTSAEDRNIAQKALASIIEGMVFMGAYVGTRDYNRAIEIKDNQSDYRARQFEAGWQEVIKEAKSNIVIKNIDVFFGNVTSNLSLLKLAGVPIKDIIKYHRIAYIAAEDFQRDTARKLELENMIDSGYFPDGEVSMRRELKRVSDALERNPAKKMMDAGLMPTIVEDIDTSDDLYSYKSQLASKVEGVTNRIPAGLRGVAKQLYATQDSWYFQKMNRATQLSDFVARYTLIEHVMNRKENPLSQDDAMFYASEAFINYDIPSHRYMNYANSIGLVMFTKYYMRVQRMIAFLLKNHPAEALTLSLLHNYVGGVESVLDSFFPGRIGNNPFTVGVLGYPSSVSHITPIVLLTSPLR